MSSQKPSLSHYIAATVTVLKENYLVAILITLLIGYIIITAYTKQGQIPGNGTNTIETQKLNSIKRYTVQKGDDLWKIAEETYGSGYNAYDIAKANNIPNPNIINEGEKLILPTLSPGQSTVGDISDEAASTEIDSPQNNRTYTIQQGDTLWNIALGAYGDGYAWTKIAKANNLSNPDIIHAGNKLTLP